MAAYFFDSSALVKRYHPEVGTADVNRLFSEQHSRHFSARLAVVEVQSALVRKGREGLISLTDLDVVHQRFLDEITQRRLQVVRMTDLHYRTAERLIRQYGPKHGGRRVRGVEARDLHPAGGVRGRLPCCYRGGFRRLPCLHCQPRSTETLSKLGKSDTIHSCVRWINDHAGRNRLFRIPGSTSRRAVAGPANLPARQRLQRGEGFCIAQGRATQ